MQRIVDNVIAVTKESVKTFTYESLNNIVRLINGMSALLLAIMPGKTSILEGIHGWELRPTFRGPRLPRWMENGASSFNQFIHQLSIDSDTSSSLDYSSGGEDIDITYPSSPLSQSSRFSRDSSFPKIVDRRRHWVRLVLSWLLLPLRILLGIPRKLFNLASRQASETPVRARNHRSLTMHSPRRFQSLKDHVVHQATDRRRGVVEDLHLGIEIFIESIFDNVHKAAHCLLDPADTFRRVFIWFFSRGSGSEDTPGDGLGISVPAAVLSDNDPTPIERRTIFHNSLNTDARTCRDVITELGYPYEAIRVVTADGYVLILERIPRRDARKVVYLQHGILDSSMGWVSNGVIGSPAFASFDQGYDVFLGNFRGLVSREHIDKSISSRQYWTYSINEHGIEDIPAMIEQIHEIKISELKPRESYLEEENNTDQPYKICAICHSLGGAGILMYVLTRRIEEKPHRLSRLILLSPAGFHHDSTLVFTTIESLFLLFAPLLAPFLQAFYIPTRFFRMLLNKLARDFHNLPAVGGLVQTLMSYVVGGDSSNWVGVLGSPHYNMDDMPGVAFRVALHLAQMKHSRKFTMFDYGRKDKVVKPSMVREHLRLMKDAGVDVSFNEFEYAHLDFMFSHREELLSYVMSRLLLVDPNSKLVHRQKSLKINRKDVNGAECVNK